MADEILSVPGSAEPAPSSEPASSQTTGTSDLLAITPQPGLGVTPDPATPDAQPVAGVEPTLTEVETKALGEKAGKAFAYFRTENASLKQELSNYQEKIKAAEARPSLALDAPLEEWDGVSRLRALNLPEAYMGKLVGGVVYEYLPEVLPDALSHFNAFPQEAQAQMASAIIGALASEMSITPDEVMARLTGTSIPSDSYADKLIAEGYTEDHPLVKEARNRDAALAAERERVEAHNQKFAAYDEQQRKIAEAEAARVRAERLAPLAQHLDTVKTGFLTKLPVPEGYEWVHNNIKAAAEQLLNSDVEVQTARKRAEAFYEQGTPDLAAGELAKIGARVGLQYQTLAKPLLELVADNERLKTLVGEKVANRKEISGGGPLAPISPNGRAENESVADYIKRTMKARAAELMPS